MVVKEFVENSFDVGVMSIEICLKEYGSVFIEVVDNGLGVLLENYQVWFECWQLLQNFF